MILVDTSIWIDHLARGNDRLAILLDRDDVLMHPFILGELAVGTLGDRKAILSFLNGLALAEVAEDDEVMAFIETKSLFGRGIGYVDAHLLASARLSEGTSFWTRDKRLQVAAERLGIAAPPTDS